MQFNFFALYHDKIKILEHILSDTEFKIVDHYSAYGQELREYKSIQEITEKFDLHKGEAYSVTFALWNEIYGEVNIARRIDLDPKYCTGHTFRYAAIGWSLQQLYFGGLSGNNLNCSKLQGFNERSAIEKDGIHSKSEQTAYKLDWKKIKSDQRKLKSFIEKKLTTRKQNIYLILKEADEESNLGHIKLTDGNRTTI